MRSLLSRAKKLKITPRRDQTRQVSEDQSGLSPRLLQLGPLALPVGRREDKQRLTAAADSTLDLVQDRGCRGKVAVINADAQTGGFQRRKQLLVNPGAVGAGIGQEDIIAKGSRLCCHGAPRQGTPCRLAPLFPVAHNRTGYAEFPTCGVKFTPTEAAIPGRMFNVGYRGELYNPPIAGVLLYPTANVGASKDLRTPHPSVSPLERVTLQQANSLTHCPHPHTLMYNEQQRKTNPNRRRQPTMTTSTDDYDSPWSYSVIR